MTTSHKKIVLATSLGDSSRALIRFGHSLAERLKCELHVLHVVEPWSHGELGGALGGMVGGAVISPDIDKGYVEEAKAKLDKYVAGLGGNVLAYVESGDPVSVMMDASKDAYMVIVGSEKKRGVFRFLSNVSHIVASASSPVLVVPHGAELIDWASCEIQIADDLENDATEVCNFTFKLAESLKPQKIKHLHITGLTQENLAASLEMAMASSKFSGSGKPDVEELFESARKQMQDKMQSHSEESKALLEALDCRYEVKVISGIPSVVLEDLRTLEKATIEVFGRHQTVHKKPFSFGKVPLSSMISGKNCVLVVPTKGKA